MKATLKIPFTSSTIAFSENILPIPLIGFNLLNFGCRASLEKLYPPIKIEPAIAQTKTTKEIPIKGIAISKRFSTKRRRLSSSEKICSRVKVKLFNMIWRMPFPKKEENAQIDKTPANRTKKVPASLERGTWPFFLASSSFY